MRFRQLVILLPCHSLEDFPVHSEGEEAEGLLAGWTSLWHPALIHAVGAMPTWSRMDDPPDELGELLLVAPPVSGVELPTGFIQRARDAGARVISRKTRREEIEALALDGFDPTRRGEELKDDFYALGYAYLQVQILTRQMRYASNLDELYFDTQVVAAASAAVDGRGGEAREKLAGCFDLLAQERDIYYSVDSYVLDIVMVAASTMGEALREELNRSTPVNLLMGPGVLEQLGREESESLRRDVAAAWKEGRIGVLVGDAGELPLPLLSPETIRAALLDSRQRCEELFGRAPLVFGRRRSGLTTALPALLRRSGFQGALHATMEEGQVPEGGQAKSKWEGADGVGIDCLARTPHNSAKAEFLLSLALKLGESMDMDHVATLLVARWPGQASPYWNDLCLASRYTPVLGRPVTIESYFQDTDLPSDVERFSADRYQTPFLRQAIIRKQSDPLSRWVRYWRRRAAADAIARLKTLRQCASGRPDDDASADDSLPRFLDRWAAAERLCESEGAEEEWLAPEAELQRAAEQVAAAVPCAEGRKGCLIWNPHSFVARTGVSLPGWSAPPALEKPVYAAARTSLGVQAVVDVPPLGFAWIAPQSDAAGGKRELNLADEGLLRNEFMEVLIHKETGGIRTIQVYGKRGNRLSQQLGMRLSSSGPRPYSTMAADSVELVEASPIRGVVVSRGKLLDASEQAVANFVQTFRLWRGSRILEIDIELEPTEHGSLKADPWNSYFACRFAWKDQSAELRRDVNQTRQPVGSAKRFEAPHYVEIEDAAHRTTIFTLGLPYHRRIGLSELDSLLLVRGERARTFQLGVGLDVRQPLPEAMRLMTPPVTIHDSGVPQASTHAWLFHCDARNVVATSWLPREVGGQVLGFRARLLEVSGKSTVAVIQALRPLAGARIVDYCGDTVTDCRVEDGAVHLELAAREWVELEGWWDA